MTQTETKQVEILIHLNDGSDQGYFRPYNDPSKGSVTNVGTWNSSYTAIRGADPSGPHPEWFDLSERQLAAIQEIIAEFDISEPVHVHRKVGSYRTVVEARAFKFGKNRRYYVISSEIGNSPLPASNPGYRDERVEYADALKKLKWD